MENTIGNHIADLRKSSGMTQQQLAERLNVSNKTVSKWERGESYPEITLIPVIADIFGVTSDEILRGCDKKNETAETNIIGADNALTEAAGSILSDERLIVPMAKYKINSVISMWLSAAGVILMLILAFVMQQKEAAFGVCILFAAAAVLTEVINILRTRAVLAAAAAEEGSEFSSGIYETFFRLMPYVFGTAVAAALLSLPLIIVFELSFPDGTVMTDFVFYLHSARYMALLSLALYAVAIFVTDRVLGSSSRYQDINIFPRSKVKPIIWLLAFIILAVI